MKKFLFYTCSVLALASCATRPKPVTASAPTPVVQATTKADVADFVRQIIAPRPFQSVKIQSDMDVQIGKAIPPVNASMYIEDGKKVWVNLSSLFINVARGQATPDRFQAYEKIGGTYVDSDYAYLRNLLKVEFIDYQALQNLLTGRTFVPLQPQNLSLSTTPDGETVLRSLRPEEVVVNGKPKSYTMEVAYTPQNDLSRVKVSQVGSPNQLEVSYSKWQEAAGSRFPGLVRLEMRSNRTDRITIENTKFEQTRMETPFNIPSDYKKTEIK